MKLQPFLMQVPEANETLFLKTIPEKCPFILDIIDRKTELTWQGCGTLNSYIIILCTL